MEQRPDAGQGSNTTHPPHRACSMRRGQPDGQKQTTNPTDRPLARTSLTCFDLVPSCPLLCLPSSNDACPSSPPLALCTPPPAQPQQLTKPNGWHAAARMPHGGASQGA